MFIQYFVWGSWYVTAGTYMLQTLHFSGREVGLVYGTTAISASLSPFLMGYIADKYFSVEKLLVVLQFSGAILLYILSELVNFSYFYPIILLYMLIFLPAFSLTNSVCFHHLKDTRTEFPRIRVWGTIAWIMSGLLIGFLNIESDDMPLKIAAVVSFILGCYSLTLPVSKPLIKLSKSFREIFWGEEIRTLFKDRGFRTLMISLSLICIPAAYYYSFVNAFLNEQDVSNAAGKMAVGQVTEIFVMLALPFLFRTFKLKYLVFTGLICWGVRYLLLSLGLYYESEWYYMLAITLHGPAYVLAILSIQIILDIRVPNEMRSSAQGFFSMLTLGLGAFIGTYFAGETVSLYSISDSTHLWGTIWLIPGVFGTLVAVYFLLRFKKMDF